MRHKNQVEIRGKIVHLFETPNYTVATIKTVYGSKIPNFPQVKFYGKMAEEVRSCFVGDRIEISGYLVSKLHKKEKKFIQEIVATKVIKENVASDDLNEVTIIGRVYKVFHQDNNVTRIILKSHRGKFVNSVEAFIYDKTRLGKNIGEITEKKDICVKGNIQTKKRVYPDVTRYYQDLTLREVKNEEKENDD